MLVFFTGADAVPLMGFPIDCTLSFNRDIVYPTASTCALEMTLPTRYHDNYELFKQKMVQGLLWHGGFGKQ